VPCGGRIIVTCAAALIAALALVTPAHARIAVNRSVAGIGLGMTYKEVRAVLGRPTLTTVGNGSRDLIYRKHALVVTLLRSRVVIVSTTSRRERTRAGVGVGSTEGALRRRVPGVRCGDKAAVRFCRVGSIRPGRRSTTFHIDAGRVITITVARGLA
jgi:hypothetical protein